MKTYIARLTADFNDEINKELVKEGISISFSDNILKNLIIFQTAIPLEKLCKMPIFSSVREERIGRVDI